ncbi:dihydrofolate reductase family protein [Arthrobacter sp. CDRTa11]|uniref:dihydrofolate reductase family protein n=1 Tax=Arthrobacter sp. CDRTa11 TaxID=2651199 RepID=UPI002265D0E7|nr:dihydrofolate reductase family protein [Arthrobacter sp. CDRTa11]UZX03306.1 dihydrofolate reductase family protein [Arthrobacter sp. CDRTa11]
MGQLIVQQFVTADGFAANSNNEFNAYELLEGGTAQFDQSQLAWLETVDAMVLGAATYRMFAEYWPTPASEGEIIAPALNGLRRFVFSRRLGRAPWGDLPEATLESGDAVEAIRRIKSEIEGTIVLWGSLTLSEAFFSAGEVDGVRLVTMPVAIGAGRGVFPAGKDPALLHLQSATTYDAGLVELVYTLAARQSPARQSPARQSPNQSAG